MAVCVSDSILKSQDEEWLARACDKGASGDCVHSHLPCCPTLSISAAWHVSTRVALGLHHIAAPLLDHGISEKVILPFYVEKVCYNLSSKEKHDLSSCLCCINPGARSFIIC